MIPAADSWRSRTKLLFGDDVAEQIAHRCVFVAGLGAVGSFAVEALARSGVGKLVLCDFDIVEPSNINRQLFALSTTIGEQKCALAADRVREINPDCNIVELDCRIDAANVDDLLQTYRPDVVIDAIDSVDDKCELLARCIAAGIKVVSSMGAARRLDSTKVRVGALHEVCGCPLAKLVRKGLKTALSGIGLTDFVETISSDRLCCVYSTEPPQPQVNRSMEYGARAMGSTVCVTGVFGLLAANEAMR